MPLRTDALAPGLTPKGQPLKKNKKPFSHQPPSPDERRKPPVVSRSGSAGEAEGGNQSRGPPPSAAPSALILPSQPSPPASPTCVQNPALPQPTNTHTKKKLPRGLPPAAHEGELFKTASPRDSTDETPNTSTFCSSFFVVVLFILFSSCEGTCA